MIQLQSQRREDHRHQRRGDHRHQRKQHSNSCRVKIGVHTTRTTAKIIIRTTETKISTLANLMIQTLRSTHVSIRQTVRPQLLPRRHDQTAHLQKPAMSPHLKRKKCPDTKKRKLKSTRTSTIRATKLKIMIPTIMRYLSTPTSMTIMENILIMITTMINLCQSMKDSSSCQRLPQRIQNPAVSLMEPKIQANRSRSRYSLISQ